MLQTHIPWLADGYRVRLQQEEKQQLDNVRADGTDSFVLCPEDHIESFAELRVQRSGAHTGTPQIRVHSAQPRLGGACDTDNENHGFGGGGGGDEGQGGLAGDGNGHSAWVAAKRKSGLRFARPASARNRAFRALHSRPSSAPGPSSALPPRPSSAFVSSARGKPWIKTRPSSAVFNKKDPPGKNSGGRAPGARQRPHSASPAVARPPPTRVDPYTVRQRRMEALHQAWVEDPRSGLHIGGPGGLGPSPLLMDRHARCLEQLKLPPSQWDQEEALPERPHTSCGVVGREGDLSDGWPSLHQRDNMSRVQRYIDCHRPDSASSARSVMRKELQGTYRRSLGVRGKSPHFCNFVHKVDLHSRYDISHARTSSGSDDEGRDDSMLSDPTDQDILAQWRKHSRLTGSGTEGRPGSPSSVDGRHVQDRNTNTNTNVSRTAETEDNTLSVRMIPTITIPSSPLPTAEQSLTNRSSGETSPRKSAREDSSHRGSSLDRSKSRPLSASTSPPKEAKEKPDKAKRAPVAKKTKKSSERRRKSKTASMEHAPAEASASADAQASGDASSQPTTNGLDVNAKVPDLPGLPTSGKDHGKRSKKGDRRLIPSPPGVGEKPQLPPELLELDSYSRSGYDFGDMESAATDNYNSKLRLQSWMNSRIALSQQASRFELPMDMKVLEKLSTQDYLRKFCVVTSRRVNLYQKIFMRHKDKTNTISKAGLETCLRETLVQALKENTFADLCELLDITDQTVVDFKLFSGVAAITERILYPYYTTEDTVEMPEYQRERIETADFESLDWKLHGIKVPDKMKKLLKMLQ